MPQRLTSEKNPLRIDAVAVPRCAGLIGMTLCPGKKDPYAKFGAWDRDLRADLQVIRDWGASSIVSLMEHSEFWLLGVPDFEAKVSAGFRWLWLPIPDGGVPDEAFERGWVDAGPELHRRLAGGERVLIHCRAGLGRTGMALACLGAMTGVSDPIAWVRAQYHPEAVETPEQVALVRGFAATGRLEANRQLVRDYVAALNRFDMAALRAIFAPDALVHGVLGVGPLDVAEPVWRELHEGLAMELTIEDLAAEGDRVAARYTERGRFVGAFRGQAPTGRAYEVPAMEWFILREGRILRRWGARDFAAIKAQTGLE